MKLRNQLNLQSPKQSDIIFHIFKTHSESLIGMLLNLVLATPEQKCHSRESWLGLGGKALAKHKTQDP